MILVAAIVAVVVVLFALLAAIFLYRKRANASSKAAYLHVSDELEGEFLLQSDADEDVTV